MAPRLSVVVPFSPQTAEAAASFARTLHGQAQVLLVGEGDFPLPESNGCRVIRGVPGKGRAIRTALPLLSGDVTVLQDPDLAYSTLDYPRLVTPISEGLADAVFGARSGRVRGLADRAVSRFSRLLTEAPLGDPLSGQRAVRTEALRSLGLTSNGDDVDAELLAKLSARLYRLAEVPIEPARPARSPVSAQLSRARTLYRYATTRDDADNEHEGYTTLARIETGAPNYNAWVGRRVAECCGQRVLEVGAGIGTITAQLEAGRELVVALEMEPFYVERLERRFRGKEHVRPMLQDVAHTDWDGLRKERIDTVVLSNVLEHIEGDAAAVEGFRQLLPPGGRLVVLVPALSWLFGSMDEAVGHHRRYDDNSLRALLEGAGLEVERLEWMNLVGIPGWLVNSRLLRRRSMPVLQLRLYDQVAPWLARAEAMFPRLPIGMSLFAVARAPGGAQSA